jgi:hypothetical protein
MSPDPADWSFEACQTRMRDATQAINSRENAYDLAAQRAADAEAVYRAQLALKFKEYRDAGMAVDAATTHARGDVATLSRERDYAKDLVKLALAQIEDARDSRRSLWRLVEWARDRDLAQGKVQMELDARMGR